MSTPKDKLRLLARAAIVASKGDTEKAHIRLDKQIIDENDAALERELTAAYRVTAIRALLATHYNELRAEGQVQEPTATRINTTDYDRTTQRPATWASQHVEKIKDRTESERGRYLDGFRVNGEPIGDCTAEVVLARADGIERDARFMRLMASGVPPQGKIRDYVTEAEAHERWDMAERAPTIPSILDPRQENIALMWKWLIKGIKTRADYAAALARAAELMNAEPHTRDGVELDGLAHAIKEYEERAA